MKRLSALINEVTESVSGRDLAKAISKSESYVAQIRAGKVVPTNETLAILAATFCPDRCAELLLAGIYARVEGFKGTPKLKGKELEELARSSLDALAAKAGKLGAQAIRLDGRTFHDFPEAFYPLAIVTGDKRESGGIHMSIADLGARSATPADTRWLLNLGLRADVIKHIDKNFLLLAEPALTDRFAEMNLLVVGSPAANHLARIVNRTAVFRFNYSVEADHGIEKVIEHARDLHPVVLAGYKEEQAKPLGDRMRAMFTGGILDPTFPEEYVAAPYARVAGQVGFDFGVLTFAANPYYATRCQTEHRENDHKYVAIMAAGIHHPATAHAVRLLGKDQREAGVFEKHPYGGVLRVALDTNVHFAERTERAMCFWEDRADDSRQESDDQKGLLLGEIRKIEKGLTGGVYKNLQLTLEEATVCRELIERL